MVLRCVFPPSQRDVSDPGDAASAASNRVFEPARLNDWFEAVTEKQYTRELLFDVGVRS